MIPGASERRSAGTRVSGPSRRARDVVRRCRPMRIVPFAVASATRRGGGLAAGLARRSRGPVAGAWPGAGRAAAAGSLLFGWTYRAAGGHRDRRRPGLVALGRAAGRTPRTPRTRVPRRRTVALRRRDGRDRVRADVRDRALRHDPVLDPHGPAHPADARRRAAHRALGAGHAAPAGLVVRDAPSLDPAGPALAGRPRPRAPGRRVARVRGRPVVGALHARSSTRRSRTRCSTTSSTSCSSGARCCSGGRPSRSTRRRIGCRTRCGSSTCSCR